MIKIIRRKIINVNIIGYNSVALVSHHQSSLSPPSLIRLEKDVKIKRCARRKSRSINLSAIDISTEITIKGFV